MNLRTLFSALLIFLVVGATAQAQTRWNLTTADFQAQSINLMEIDAQGIRYTDKAATEQTLPMDQFVGMASLTTPQARAGAKWMAILSTGGKLAGDVTALKDEKLTFTGALVGEMTFPLRQVIRIDSLPRAAAIKKVPPSKTHDTLLLANGDSVIGTVDSISPSVVTIKTDAGASDVPLDSIAAIVFAETGAPAGPAEKGFRIRLDDGSNLTAAAVAAQGANVTLTLPGDAKRTLELGRVISIEQLDGPVCWLSSVIPTENVQTPFLDTSWPTRMNTNVLGEPIKFAAKTYTHGIGVHSKSLLTWALDGTYKSFRTQFAIDGNQPYADVDVRILLDGKVVHETKDLKTGILSPVTTVDLGSAKTISLVVDYGAGYDVQDRVNWIEPALLRAAASPPTTQP